MLKTLAEVAGWDESHNLGHAAVSGPSRKSLRSRSRHCGRSAVAAEVRAVEP